MENLPTYRLTQSGPEAQEILDQVNLNTVDIEQLKRLYQALNQSEPEIIEPTDTWPVANPEENVIYRVIDRENTPPQYYTDYMWNGTSMVPMAKYDNAIDNEPTANSNNLVKSGGVYSFVHANGGAYDISAAHAVGGVLATYDDLADALGTNGANVPAAVRKGGMSIKFVLSSDNKYVQYRYMSSSTTDANIANVNNWQGVDDEPTSESNNLVKSGGVASVGGFYIEEGFEWVRVITDKDGKFLAGIKKDGSVEWSVGVPTPIKEYITSVLNSLGLEEISKKVEDLEWETMQPSEIIENYYITRAGFISSFNGSYIHKYVIEADCILKYKTTLSNVVMCPYLVYKKEGKSVGGMQVYDGMLLLKKGDVVYIGYYNGGAESDIKVWYQNINDSVFVSDFIFSNLGYVKGEADLVSGQNYINHKVVDVKLNQGEQYAIKFITGTGNVDRVTIYGYKEDETEVTLVEETSIYNVVHFKTCPDDIVSIGLRMTAARITTPGSVYIEVSKGYLYNLLAKSESAGGDDYYAQKNIAYFGTSVPAQGYPQIVGVKLGANVYNQAIGSSMMRCGIPNSDYLNHNELGDDLGLGNIYFSNIMRSMSRTQKELKYIFDNWTADRRKANLIAKGYTAEQVANVKGYSYYIGGTFPEEGTDPSVSPAWPDSKPVDVYAGNGETYKNFRKLAYSYCWDNSVDIEADLQMTGAITEAIDGRLEKFINGTVDTALFVFDHFRNDSLDATASQFLEIPQEPTDRNYAEGAFNYLMQQILLVKPNAQIVIVGHVDNDDTKNQLGHVWEAQEIAANRWGIPLLKLWDLLGIRCFRWVTTTGYWDSNGVWHEDGYNGSNHVWKSNNGLTAAEYENPRQIMIDGVLTWVHDLTTRMIWFKDDIHPSGTLALNHFAEIIAKWISNLKK